MSCLPVIIFILSGPPKDSYVKDLVIRLCCYREVMAPLKGGVSEKELDHWRHDLEWNTEILVFTLQVVSQAPLGKAFPLHVLRP